MCLLQHTLFFSHPLEVAKLLAYCIMKINFGEIVVLAVGVVCDVKVPHAMQAKVAPQPAPVTLWRPY